LLIKAFASIADRFPEWELVIVGEGPERDRLVELSRSNGSWERIWLAGPVGNITDWYASADLFVLSSRFEGFPNTLLEAMAHGLPAIAADCLTGPRALITHEFDGVLVPPDDVVGLAEGMMRLMGDDAMRRLFGERASVAGERFSIERVGAMWTNIISGEGL
jgi:glycosyltransferase involved in cell wall biosynthesis